MSSLDAEGGLSRRKARQAASTMPPTNLQGKQFVNQNKNLHSDEPNKNQQEF
jgi:hypothetical protein